MKDFNTLPSEVQEKAKEVLKAYDKVHVIYEYGEYHVMAGLSIKTHYADDHEFMGTYLATDIFSPDECIINYIEAFHAYPMAYKGKKDWDMIRSLTWNDKVRFDENHNIVKV
jgi:hypothetical protein